MYMYIYNKQQTHNSIYRHFCPGYPGYAFYPMFLTSGFLKHAFYFPRMPFLTGNPSFHQGKLSRSKLLLILPTPKGWKAEST